MCSGPVHAHPSPPGLRRTLLASARRMHAPPNLPRTRGVLRCTVPFCSCPASLQARPAAAGPQGRPPWSVCWQCVGGSWVPGRGRGGHRARWWRWCARMPHAAGEGAHPPQQTLPQVERGGGVRARTGWWWWWCAHHQTSKHAGAPRRTRAWDIVHSHPLTHSPPLPPRPRHTHTHTRPPRRAQRAHAPRVAALPAGCQQLVELGFAAAAVPAVRCRCGPRAGGGSGGGVRGAQGALRRQGPCQAWGRCPWPLGAAVRAALCAHGRMWAHVGHGPGRQAGRWRGWGFKRGVHVCAGGGQAPGWWVRRQREGGKRGCRGA